jgi:hypothetical protein
MHVTLETGTTIITLPENASTELIDAIKTAILQNRTSAKGIVLIRVKTKADIITIDLGLKSIEPTPTLQRALNDLISLSIQSRAA